MDRATHSASGGAVPWRTSSWKSMGFAGNRPRWGEPMDETWCNQCNQPKWRYIYIYTIQRYSENSWLKLQLQRFIRFFTAFRIAWTFLAKLCSWLTRASLSVISQMFRPNPPGWSGNESNTNCLGPFSLDHHHYIYIYIYISCVYIPREPTSMEFIGSLAKPSSSQKNQVLPNHEFSIDL